MLGKAAVFGLAVLAGVSTRVAERTWARYSALLLNTALIAWNLHYVWFALSVENVMAFLLYPLVSAIVWQIAFRSIVLQ